MYVLKYKNIKLFFLTFFLTLVLPASPPKFVSVEELMETAKGVTNLALAHEIMVNQAFQVKPAELPEGR